MGKRSPILGYNHNIRHRGLVFHVQTEDSGVNNPHIFTHLFYGGVILSSRKLDYDREASEEAVKALMQAQHRATLKDLKKGTFCDKIDSYLGGNPDLLPRETDVAKAIEAAEAREVSDTETTDPDRRPIPDALAVPEGSDISGAFDAITGPHSLDDVGVVHSPPPPPIPPPPGAHTPGAYSQHRRGGSTPPQSAIPVVSRPPTQIRGSRATPPPTPRGAQSQSTPRRRPGSSGGVVVSRPAVIVGAPPKIVGGNPRHHQSSRTTRTRKAREDSSASDSLFGQDLISEKSLDEVILAYLSEDSTDD